MKVRIPINIHAKSQVDRSTHNENLGEGSNEPPLEGICLAKGLRLEGLTVCAWLQNIHECGCAKGLECLRRSKKRFCVKHRPSPTTPLPTEEPGSGGGHF